MNKAPVIGIDLGTTNSCVGVFQNGKVDIIPNDIGERTTPSYIAFTESGRLIGDAAKNQITRNLTNTIFDAKRLIGRKFEDREIQEDMKLWPFKVVKDTKSDRPQFQITYQKQEMKFYPEEILSMLLQKLKQTATNFLGKEVKDAVVAVPSYFNESQRQSIKDAGIISGVNILRIINESSAAALAYGFYKEYHDGRNVLIFDLGGGNFNVSLLTLEDGLFEVRAINGNTHLGGEDFDNKLVEYCVEEFRRKTGIDIKKNAKALRRVKVSCEKAKRALSAATQTNVDIEALMDGEDLNVVITRSKFEDLCLDLFKKCMPPLENVIKDAKMKKNEVHEIVLVGGSTRIPKIQQMIKEFFNGKEPNKSINPDEAVAYGAAVKAAIIENVKNQIIGKLVLLDATPFSLGIEIEGGVMNVFIPRNSSLPHKQTQILPIYADNQTTMTVQVFEGERQLAKDNHKLGKFILEGIPPMPKGKLKIELTFDLDVDSILNVTAVEKSTGKENKILITNYKEGFSKDDIDRFIKEAEKFKDKDNKIKERIEAKKGLEQYCYQIKHQIEQIIERKIDEILKWSNDNPAASKEEYDAKVKEIEAIFNPIMQKIYEQVGGAPGGIPNFGGAGFPGGTPGSGP